MKARIQRSWAKVRTFVLATSVTWPTQARVAVVGARGRGTGRAWPARRARSKANRRQRSTPGPGVDRGLDRDLLGRPLAGEAAGADVEVLVVLADDDHVDVVGPLALDRRLDARVEPDRAEVDVLVEVEPEPEQDPLLEDARRHAGMPDRAQEDRVAAPEVVERPSSGRTSPVFR